MNKKSLFPFLGRGAAGGALGGFTILMATITWYLVTLGGIPYAYLFIFQGLPLALGVGILVGGFVGAIIWTLGQVKAREFSSVGRTVIGFVIVLVVVVLFVALRPQDPEKLRFPREQVSWTQQAIKVVMLALVLGALPGVLAKPKRNPS